MSKSKDYRSRTYKSKSNSGLASAQIAGPSPNKIALSFIVISILALAAGFGWNAWQGASGADTRTVDTASAQAAEVASQANAPGPDVPLLDTVGTKLGEIAPDFTAPTLDGGTFTLTEQRGQPTIVFFMAYWCGTCVPEGQALAQLEQEYGDNLSIVALDVDPSSTPETLTRFKEMADNGEFAWAFDTGQKVTAAYEVAALDTTLILDREGHVIYKDQWPSPYQTLKDELVKLGL
jgi:peroxiredoxin